MQFGATFCRLVQFDADWCILVQLCAVWCNLGCLVHVKCSLVQFGGIWCCLVHLSATWCRLVLLGASWCSLVQLVQLDADWCSLAHFGATWCYLVQLSATWTKKRVGSSSGRSQDCVRLGTSQDKSRFDLFELSFSTITVFWERKLRAQGFLHKEIRICAVVGCTSSTYQLQKWRKGFCTSHNCHRTSQDCTCPDLFQLYPCPTFKGDPEKRKEWVKSINQKTLKQGKTGSQAKMTGFVPNVLWMDSLP